MRPLDPQAIDDALAALAFSDGERGGSRRRPLSGVYMLATYDYRKERLCRAFGSSMSPTEVWFMDAEARRLVDHIDYTQEYGMQRLRGYLILEEGETGPAPSAAASNDTEGEGERHAGAD